MPRNRSFADVLHELYYAEQTGAYFITTKESSEDLFKIYLKNGEIVAVTFGSVSGKDALDILEYYTLAEGTLFEGVAVPAGTPPFKFSMEKFIEMMRKSNTMIRVP